MPQELSVLFQDRFSHWPRAFQIGQTGRPLNPREPVSPFPELGSQVYGITYSSQCGLWESNPGLHNTWPGLYPNAVPPQLSGLTLSLTAASLHPHAKTWKAKLRPKTTKEKESASCEVNPQPQLQLQTKASEPASLQHSPCLCPWETDTLTTLTFHPLAIIPWRVYLNVCHTRKSSRMSYHFWEPSCSSLKARCLSGFCSYCFRHDQNITPNSGSCSGPSLVKIRY